MVEQLKNDFKQESCLFEGPENVTFKNNSDLLEATVKILDNSNEENLQKSNLIDPEDSVVSALPKNAPEIYDKEYFDRLFDWNTIEERLKKFAQKRRNFKEPNMQFANQKFKNDEMSCESPNLKSNQDQCSVKLREMHLCTPRSESERKRKSKDLLQNRRSTGFLSFEDIENAIKEIEEIGSNIQKTFTSVNNDPQSDIGFSTTEKVENNLQTNDEIVEKISANIANIDNTDDGSVTLREKKSSSPYNSEASRKRRSRNLLLNRRSTGYVNAEDVEKAKSIDQQDDDINLDLDD